MKPYIKVMTPCYGGQITTTYALSLLNLLVACQQRGISLGWRLHSGDALITRARAECVAHFLEDQHATHLLFIDADIGFEPEQVFRLLEFDAEVTAAAYPLKGLDWERITKTIKAGRPNPDSASLLYVLGWEKPTQIQARNNFARVQYAGTGFLMIRREALLRLCTAHPELRYTTTHAQRDALKDTQYRVALFDCMIEPETRAYLSEDFAFCRRWADLGGEIWLDLQSKLTHVGTMGFKGDLSTQLEPMKPPAQTPDGSLTMQSGSEGKDAGPVVISPSR